MFVLLLKVFLLPNNETRNTLRTQTEVKQYLKKSILVHLHLFTRI